MAVLTSISFPLMGVALVQSLRQRNRNAIGICEHVVIPEADDAIAFGLHRNRPIAIRLLAMLPAIDLDDQSRPVTAEIGEKAADRHLATKAHLGEMLAQYGSHLPFGVGRIGAQ